MDQPFSFGAWLRRRRKALDMTQDELARCAGCALGTIKGIEADDRRPSKQLAAHLAECVGLEGEEQAAFVKAARAALIVDQLPSALPPVQPLAPTPGTAEAASVAPMPALAAGGNGTTAAQVAAPGSALPGGTVTFLFTDIEGSTQLWQRHPQATGAAVARHEALLREAIASAGGVVFKTVGDAIYAAFGSALDALRAALAGQRALRAEPWGATGPLRVRMALHTGVVVERAGDYLGLPLSRIARLLAAGHGDQVLLSHVTQELVREQLPPHTELHDLGMHRLKDLNLPEQIFQLAAPDLPSDFPLLTTLDPRRTNLPAQPTPLIGREREIADVTVLLRRADVRLVTLTGPGGTGKTRLGLQVTAELLDDFVDGAYFVDLAPISDPALVASAIAQTLGVKETGGRPPLENLKAYLCEKHLLLLLDNFEQVLSAVPVVVELLAAAPRLKALITSREVLHLRGEKEFPVPPLELPDPQHPKQIETLSQYAAVQLFIARAQDVKPDFAVTNQNAPAIAEICARLDGLPLALELAAARIKLFAPEALLGRLAAGGLAMLTGGARDLPARQQTLRATIAWSYNLLEAAERTLFAQLGVFVGGWTLEAAEAICNATGDLPLDILDGLAALADKSLVRQTEDISGTPRFTMLETIRAYALERLAARDEAGTLRRQHASYYLALAEAAEPELRRAQQKAWWNRLETEHDNLRAALAWALDDGDVEIGLRVAGALWWFWFLRGYWNEGRDWLARALARTELPGQTAARAKALWGAAMLAGYQADFATACAMSEENRAISWVLGDRGGYARALLSMAWATYGAGDLAATRTLVEESLALFREVGDLWHQSYASIFLTNVSQNQHDFAAARRLGQESLALFQRLGDGWGQAEALGNLADIVYSLGNYEEAVRFAEQYLTIAQSLHDRRGYAYALTHLAALARTQGDYARMTALFEESLVLQHELGNKEGYSWALYGLGIAAQRQGDAQRATALLAETLALSQETGSIIGPTAYLEGMAGVAAMLGQPSLAVRLYGAAAARRDALGSPPMPDERRYYEQQLAEARDLLGDATFEAAWAEGQAMTVEQGIAYARSVGD